jgi:hypothetical protein
MPTLGNKKMNNSQPCFLPAAISFPALFPTTVIPFPLSSLLIVLPMLPLPIRTTTIAAAVVAIIRHVHVYRCHRNPSLASSPFPQ